ncbi:MAG TPA: hypothetical protein VH105_11585 [Burkholderiales bacterium]|nr:hypothetical protein [Burkholderiales bacterium]
MLAFAAALSAGAAHAAMFAAVASPPRFELAGKPGETVRDSVEISNADIEPGNYRLFTNDWVLDSGGGPAFEDALAANSCRPWVALERRSIVLNPNAVRKIRFEVQIPADAPTGECRFAIMIEQDEGTLSRAMAGNLPVPVQGRIAVIVYVRIGDAAPKLRLLDVHLAEVNGQQVPVAKVINEGLSHDRLDGVLGATDADRQAINFAVSQRPILAGETRDLPFSVFVADPGEKPPAKWRMPLQLKGTLEAESGLRLPIDLKMP